MASIIDELSLKIKITLQLYICTYVTDRKKDLVKLQGGEYVSLGKVESQLKTCPVVDNICIYGNPFHMYTIALVVPNRHHLIDMAKKLNIENVNEISIEELFSNKELEKAVVDELAVHGRKSMLILMFWSLNYVVIIFYGCN